MKTAGHLCKCSEWQSCDFTKASPQLSTGGREGGAMQVLLEGSGEWWCEGNTCEGRGQAQSWPQPLCCAAASAQQPSHPAGLQNSSGQSGGHSADTASLALWELHCSSSKALLVSLLLDLSKARRMLCHKNSGQVKCVNLHVVFLQHL